MKLFRVITIPALLAAMCACSGPKNGAAEPSSAGASAAKAPSSAPIANPCQLLTQAEASEAIGAKLGPGDLKRWGSLTRCSYFNPANDGQKLLLDVRSEAANVPDAMLFDSYTHSTDAKPVSGIGDQALWFHNEMGTSLDILKGGRLVQIGLPGTMPTITPAMEKAARLIASRM